MATTEADSRLSVGLFGSRDVEQVLESSAFSASAKSESDLHAGFDVNNSVIIVVVMGLPEIMLGVGMIIVVVIGLSDDMLDVGKFIVVVMGLPDATSNDVIAAAFASILASGEICVADGITLEVSIVHC